jgi:hypothetical protein
MSGGITPSLGGCVSPEGCEPLGDEEWISLVPPAQFVDRYVFFVDPTYGVGNLSIIRTKGDKGFEDVTLECYGVVDGWANIGTLGNYEITHLDLYRGGVGPCAESQQEATSEAPFGIVVWGTDWFASYGYPAGGSAAAINDVMVPID